MSETIYLAGPEVFLPEALEVFAEKKSICQSHGFVGLAPLDNEIAMDPVDPSETAMRIYRANEAAMDGADFCIANITPFRGISADPGTVYEIGYMRGIRKTVYGYSNVAVEYADRVLQSNWADGDGQADVEGSSVERFGLIENLMIPCGIEASAGSVLSEALAGEAAVYKRLEVFAKTVALARQQRGVSATVS